MLKDKKEKNQLKKDIKKYELTRQTHDLGHGTGTTS
jgi:hypothetical protein